MKQQIHSDTKQRETIRGMVVPAQWNEQFQVTQVLIACRNERDIRVENLESFPILTSLSQTEAVVTGFVSRKGAIETIVIESFTPLEKA